MDRDEVEVHKNVKRERGQYPAILTEIAWSIKELLYGIKSTEKMISLLLSVINKRWQKMALNFNTYQIHKQLWNSTVWGKKCHLLFSSLCSSASLWSNWSANRLALAAKPLFKSSQSNWTISKWATVGKELISRASERNCWISCNSKMRLLWSQIKLNELW